MIDLKTLAQKLASDTALKGDIETYPIILQTLEEVQKQTMAAVEETIKDSINKYEHLRRVEYLCSVQACQTMVDSIGDNIRTALKNPNG